MLLPTLPLLQRSFPVYGHVRNTVYRFTAQAVNSVGAGPEKSPRVLFYECTKYFNDTGSGCRVRWDTIASGRSSEGVGTWQCSCWLPSDRLWPQAAGVSDGPKAHGGLTRVGCTQMPGLARTLHPSLG